MSSFGARGLTNKGISLQAKAQSGAELKYTKFVLGDGYLAGQSIAALTNVISPKKTADIARLKMTPPNQARIGFILSNQDITTGFYFRELGLYAFDPDEGEILYWYGNAGDTADYIPPKSGSDVIAKNFDILALVGQASNVTAIINESLVYATHDDVEAAIQEARKYTDEQNNAKILPSMSFKASDVGTLYPKGMSMFWINYGKRDGWPADNGQVVTWYLAQNRLSQIFFETDVRSLRMWLRRWSDNQKIWTDFLELETTAGAAEKIAGALQEAKAYTDDKTSNIDAPVKAVNGKTGDVVLTADDVGAAPKEHKHDASDINSGTIAAARLPSATTGAKGIVQLSDSLYSTSTQQAATANAVKQVYDEMMLVKQSVVEGKGVIAEVINGKGGGPVSANNTFPELAAAIANIPSGGALLPNISVWLRKSTIEEGIGYETADAAVLPARTNGIVFTATRGGSSGVQCGGMQPGGFAEILLTDSNGASVALLRSSSENGSYADSLNVDSIFINVMARKAVVYYRRSDYYLTAEALLTSLNTVGPLKLQVRVYKEDKPGTGYAQASLGGWAFMA